MSKLTVLDRPDRVRKIDKSNMLRLCENTPDLSRDAIKRAREARIPATSKSPKNVIVIGMGGSAIGGELLKDWLHDRASIPIEVCRDYVLPSYANESSLVVAVSYSGETEETLSAFLEAVKNRCMVTAITSGGHLKAFSRKLKIPHVTIPIGFPPRAAIAYMFFPLIVLMERVHIVKKTKEEIKEALRILQKVSEENALRIPLKDNKAKKFALEIENTVPIVYGFRQYSAVARRLKCQFNENSKIPSKFDIFPELNHNEVVGWEAPKNLTKTFSLILIRDLKEPPEIKQRIEITKQIVSQKVSKILEIQAVGKQKLAKMLSTMYMGGFISIYLALLRGIDPAPTKTISYLKEKMKKESDMNSWIKKRIEKID